MNGKEIDKAELQKISTDSVTISILKPEESIEKYGEKGKNGAILIITKK